MKDISGKEEEHNLNADQQRVLDFILENPKRSVFITGGAGTGKSVLLRAIAKSLPSDVTYLTAPTGVAALNIGGITLHSFLRLMPESQFDLRSYMKSKVFADVQRRFWTCNTIVIDEISMVDPTVFQAADRIAQITRGSALPFGGMQLILCGDFMQLPPVSSTGDAGRMRMLDEEAEDDDAVVDENAKQAPSSSSSAGAADGKATNNNNNNPWWKKKNSMQPFNRCAADTESKYCFQTQEWQNLNPKYFTLKQVMRQRQPELINLLNAVRFGTQTDAMIKRILLPPEQSSLEADVLDPNAPVRIFCRNREVNERNRDCYHTMKKSPELLLRHFDAKVATADIPLRREMVYYCAMEGEARVFGKVISKTLRLCVGSRVMLLRNLDVGGGLVNGSTGVVVGFRDQSADLSTETLSDETTSFTMAGRSQKKGGGADGGKKNKKGNNSPAAANNSATNSNSGVTDEVNAEFEMKYRDKPSEPLQPITDCYPVVRFNGVAQPVVVRPVVWTQKSGAAVSSKLMQLPLRHAWAATAHKVQGCSFDKVQVDLSSAFEYGQAYVALSRARTIENLRVIGYDQKLVQACPIASEFHLKTAVEAEKKGAAADTVNKTTKK